MFNEVKSANVVNITLYPIGKQDAYSRHRSKRYRECASLSFSSLMAQAGSDEPVSHDQHEAILDFLQEHITYCDEILEHVLSSIESTSPSFTDEGNTYLDALGHSAKAILCRIRKTRGTGNLIT